MLRQIRACFGGKVKFYKRQWNGYIIRFDHNYDELRLIPVISLIPYFWDNEIVFDIGIKTPKGEKVSECWEFEWELRDLDGNIITQGEHTKSGNGKIQVTNKGFRRKFLNKYNTLEKRAVVLGNLHPHKEYMLFANFRNNKGETTGLNKMATLTVDDRTSYQMQVFLVMFAVFMTIIVGFVARTCEIPTP